MIKGAVLLPGYDERVVHNTSKDFRCWTVRNIDLRVRFPLREIISGQGPPGYEVWEARGATVMTARYPSPEVGLPFEAPGNYQNTYTGFTAPAIAKVRTSPRIGPLGVQVKVGRLVNGFADLTFTFYFDGVKWVLAPPVAQGVTGTLVAELTWLR